MGWMSPEEIQWDQVGTVYPGTFNVLVLIDLQESYPEHGTLLELRVLR